MGRRVMYDIKDIDDAWSRGYARSRESLLDVIRETTGIQFKDMVNLIIWIKEHKEIEDAKQRN
jgi:hypothetical protein